jgi:hypothetical protein
MKPKAVAAVLIAGIVLLAVGTALAATLPSTRTPQAAANRAASNPVPTTNSRKRARRVNVAPITRSTSGASGSTTSTTHPASSPPSTAFVLSTISYAVKPMDTVATIEHWFAQHGYGVQFTANLLVIESNKNLLVPGAIVSISNGVMTIQSPA